MISHTDIWNAIDKLAARQGKTASGLARSAGLDATAFNKSKRMSKDGRPRWPTVESIAKVLNATGETFSAFATSIDGLDYSQVAGDVLYSDNDNGQVPLLGLAEAGAGGYFADGETPPGQVLAQIALPSVQEDGLFALEVSGDSMLPIFRHGDVIVVSMAVARARGDRVVVKTVDGEVTAKILHRQSETQIELHSMNPEHGPRILDLADVAWIARVMWVRQ